MGMFDHIVAKCTTPNCDGEFYGQTKFGDPCMNTYEIEDEMDPVDASACAGEILICSVCKAGVKVLVPELEKVKVALKPMRKTKRYYICEEDTTVVDNLERMLQAKRMFVTKEEYLRAEISAGLVSISPTEPTGPSFRYTKGTITVFGYIEDNYREIDAHDE
jgi:hypothetical protein